MEGMQRLLRIQPSKVIDAARRGSFAAIEALSTNSLDVIPVAYQPEVVALFCAHIQKTPVRPDTHPYDIVQCILGLSILIQMPNLICLPDVIRTYPKLLQWFAHFSNEASRGQALGDREALSAYMHVLYLLVKDPELRSCILETPDTIQVATMMWLATDDENVLPVYPGGAKAFALLLHYLPVPITDLLFDATSGNVDLIATHAVLPLRLALRTHPYPHDGFFHSYVWLLEEFSMPRPATTFVPAMLAAGAVRLVTSTLLRFSRRDIALEGPHEIVGACLRTLRHLVETGTGIKWVAQSVRSGLLAALFNIAPNLDTLNQNAHDAYMAFIQDIIPRYLLFRPVIKAVETAFTELANGPNISRHFPQRFVDSWVVLKKTAEERISYMQNFWLLQCENCGKSDSKSAFRRCSRCRLGHYCSVRCQEADWRVHKTRCSQWRPPPVQLDGVVSLHEQQFQVKWLILNDDALGLAASILALRKSPGPPSRTRYLSSRCVVMDCTVVPVRLRLGSISEEYRKEAGQGVQVQSNVRLGQQVHSVVLFVHNAILREVRVTMIDDVLDRVPVEYGGRGIYED